MIFPFEFARSPEPGSTQDDRPKTNRAILFLIVAGFALLLFFLLRANKLTGVLRSSVSLPVERWKHWGPIGYD
jgi:hypothetical protein